MKVDISIAKARQATTAGASFVSGSVKMRFRVEPLHVVPVQGRSRTTGDELRSVQPSWDPWTSGTCRGVKDPMASAVPGLVQQAH